MKKFTTNLILALIAMIPLASRVHAKGSGSASSIFPIVHAPSARAAALGEAFLSAENDISALNYTPTALGSLTSPQVAYLFQRGILDDSYSNFTIGAPKGQNGFGLSLGYYNGGDVTLYDGVSESNVTGKRDLSLGLGFSHNIENISMGVTVKYISSELASSVNANTFAMDLGLSNKMSERLNLSAALRNMGRALNYIDSDTSLPHIFQLGMNYKLLQGNHPTHLMFDTPYYIEEKSLRSSIGLESFIGPMAVRLGYRTGSELEGFSIGTGFSFGRASLDYSLGLVNDLNTKHMISFTTKFGNERAANHLITSNEKKPFVLNKNKIRKNGRIYEVKNGDTLQTIAESLYGNPDKWSKIYFANSDQLMSTDLSQAVGKKIIVP